MDNPKRPSNDPSQPVSAVSAAASLSTTLPPEPVAPTVTAPISSTNATLTQQPVVPANQAGNDPGAALPTAPAVNPDQQAAHLHKEPEHVIGREVEKAKADRRDVMGVKPQGRIVEGIEDDRLFAMLRRFDIVSVLHLED